MTEPIKIPFTPIILRHQKPTESNDCFIKLYETHLHFHCEFIADESVDDNDETLGIKEGVNNYFDTYAMKRSISGLEMAITSDNKWGVYVIVTGFAKDVKVYFKSRTKAEEMRDKILEWLLK